MLGDPGSLQPPRQCLTIKPNQMEELNRVLVSLSREVIGLNTKLMEIETRMAGLESRETDSEQPRKKMRRRACDIEKNFKVKHFG